MDIAIHGSLIQQIKGTVAEALKNSIFTKETLIPISFVLTLIAPIVYVTQLAARVETLETRLETLQATSITKEVFQLKMENFETKLDAVLNAVEQKSKGK